jgi:hypothetical protein
MGDVTPLGNCVACIKHMSQGGRPAWTLPFNRLASDPLRRQIA